MNSFLELNWLAKADKYIRLPVVVSIDRANYSGCFYYPEKEEYLIGDKYYSADNGIIVLSEDQVVTNARLRSTLAHEWRHLWQHYNYGKKEYYQPWDIDEHLSYKQRIINFFLDPWEMDALIFEYKKSYCEDIAEWYEWIVKKNDTHKS